MEGLMRNYETVDQNHLADLVMIIAQNIEASLMQSGAEPGKDYTILDLFQMANPYAFEIFKSRDDIAYTI